MAIYIIRGFLHPWKKRPEGYAAHPVGCDSSLQIVMAVWRLVWIQTFWVGCDSPLLTIMVRQKAIIICRGLSHPTRSLSRIFCRGQERPKGRKGTLRPDFQANTRLRIFFLKPMSPQDTGRQLWGNQCSGSMTFWGGSGSGSSDPCFWLMDPDPGSGSCYFRHWPTRCQQIIFNKKLFCLLLFEGTFTSFFKDKKSKRVTNRRNQGCSKFFCMTIEGSGSGSRRPKNMWIRWFLIRNTTGGNPGTVSLRQFRNNEAWIPLGAGKPSDE